MIYVIDQNYFRSDELRNLVLSERRAKFVIPDVALLEMCKGDHWRETMQGSLSTLANCRTRVFHSLSVGEGLNHEMETLSSIEGRLLPLQFRTFVRSVLEDIKLGASTKGVRVISENIVEAQEEIRAEELDHARNDRSLKTRTKLIEQVLNGEPIKQLKNGQASDEDRLSLIHRISLELLQTHLEQSGSSKNKIRVFLKTKPLLLRYFLLSVRHAVEWAKMGGLSSLPATKVTNDVLDQDYVAIGSFFDRLLSKESKVLEADADLRLLLAMDA
jgi:hypothetical protein